MKKIIVGFDGTNQAKDALHLGAAIADVFDAQLIVASAIEYGPDPFLETEGYEDYNKIKAEHFEQVFNQARAELGSRDFERRELRNTAAHGLTDLAEVTKADLIAVGSTHRGPIGRVFAGTVAARLFHGAPCAVMVASRGWSDREHVGLGLIGVGYDGSDESTQALALAEKLAKALDAKIRVITVAPYTGVDAHLGPVEVMREVWAESLKEAVDSVSERIETEGVLRQGRPATELALQAVELDLLVVGSRAYGPLRRTLVGSVSGELVRTAPCPVLVVPRGVESRQETEAEESAAVA